MKQPRRYGFTLIELLVVIAVIVILAAILFPVFARARDRARQSLCASHLTQLAKAGMMYLDDYDDRFPSCYRTPFGHSALDIHALLQPYLRDWEVFYCPDRHTVRPDCVDRTGQFGSPVTCMGYGYNWGTGTGEQGSPTKGDGLVRGGPRLGQVTGVCHCEVAQPARCLFLGDTNDHDLLTLWRDAMPGVWRRGPDGTPVNGAGDPYEPARHSGGNNFAFVDGHLQWLRFPGGPWIDGGPWVIPDMSMYSRTGRWEPAPPP
jgi:prepilin-type N-terminal cleavage/methylation domain-containing protein/prepilin-type processing-associated H-X9-DG protein